MRMLGLYDKFIVKRRDGGHRKGRRHYGCSYYVLDIDHDPDSIPALEAYAKSARSHGKEVLANDIDALLISKGI